MANRTEAVGGAPASGLSRPSKAYPKDRICKEVNCDTKLSIYNSGKFCYSHQPLTVPRTRGRKIN
ncbi:hypothetical protein AXFE_10610 [Acidithrix ferrooxidans]|uniref:Uncharacterized protein n=1 Tax=Acidithrix ferrooxidans TaxID=1280514 RepID=A0A0D8HJ36_9ACTN|nr:hypothetical protein AXFE_10610 [Acidithrix ferrooxidans]